MFTDTASPLLDPVVELLAAERTARSTTITRASVGQLFRTLDLDHAAADGQLPEGTVVLVGVERDASALQYNGDCWMSIGDDYPTTWLLDNYRPHVIFRLVWLP